MAAAEWDKIKAEYITGGISCRELAEKYNLSPNVVSKKATKDGWKKARQKCGEKTAERMISASARAREEAALKGLDLTKYTMDIWNDNLRALNETIQRTPEYMLSNPSFASGIARGLETTYNLLMRMAGRSDADRRLRLEEEKLKIEREKFEMEKKRFELEMKNMEATGEQGVLWQVTVEEDETEKDEPETEADNG